jgi:hypothetical protein
MAKSLLLMFSFAMCCAVFAGNMVGVSLWVAITLMAR